MSFRVARGAALATPAFALVVCAPWHLTRFSPPKVTVAFFGVALGLFALGLRPRRQPAGAPLGAPWDLAPDRFVPRSSRWGWWGLMAWGAISLAWSPAPGRGLSLWLVWLLAGLWALLLGRVVWGEEAPRPEALRRHLAWTWLGAATVAALLAVAQRFGVARLGLHQVTATLGNPNHVAVVLVVCLPLAVALATHERGRAGRWLARALAALLIVAVLATGCRAALVALAVQALFWCVTTRASGRFRAAAVALVLVSGAMVWSQGSTTMTTTRRQSGAAHAVTGRAFIARVSARVMARRPVRGVGLGGYAAGAARAQGALLQDRPDLRSRWSHLDDAHNQVLMVGAELGAVGLAALLWLIGPPLWRLVRCRREPWARHALAAWIGLGVCSVTETTLLSPVVVLFAFGWLVLGARPEPARRPVLERPRPHFTWLTSARAASPLALAAFGLTLATSQLLAHYHLGQGLRRLQRAPVRRSDLEAAARCYDRGLAYWGAASQLRFQRALVRRDLGDLAGAAADLRRSFDEHPSPDRALLLGDLLVDQGNVSVAIPWYRRALRLHPRYQRAYNNLGVALVRAGRLPEACRYLVRARSLRPGDRTARRNVRAHCRPASPRRRPASPRRRPASLRGRPASPRRRPASPVARR